MSHSPEQEGVIKFHLKFDDRPFELPDDMLRQLNTYRSTLLSAALIGEDPARYDGYGFGNISLRLKTVTDHYAITGTQTGHLKTLTQHDIACITDTQIEQNTLSAYGHCRPSSESMTHAALYESHPEIQSVVHVHCPEIWQHSDKLALPSISANIAYGTVEMAKAVQEISRHSKLDKPFIFSMKGHEDGIVAIGKKLADCTQALLLLQAQAIKMA